MWCPACRGALPDGSRFCIHCGAAIAAYPVPVYPPACVTCGGDGSRLDRRLVVCPQCRWLRPLAPGYALDASAFLWQGDAQAMDALRSLGPLTAAARMVADQIGRPWFETTLNGVRLGERQMPDIYHTAVRAARVVGMPYMPDVYISGEQMWESMTLGSDQSAAVVLGTVLSSFKGDDLLFVLAREMGHCRAGHALWKTVLRFLVGATSRRTVMGHGLLSVLSPTKLMESAVDIPLMAWARQAEITADRAGLLVVGSEEVARRVLLSWTLRSFPIYQRLNIEAWMEQEVAGDDTGSTLSEMTTSSTPYIARRLRLMREFAQSEDLKRWRRAIEHLSRPERAPAPASPDTVRLVCPKCQAGLRISRALLDGRESTNVRCPNPQCGNILAVKRKK